MPPTVHGAPRSLSQMLREWDDESVRDLLRLRPDLADPPPITFAQLASYATTRDSVRTCLDSLNAYELWVAERVMDGDTDPCSDRNADEARDFAAGVESLRRHALLWGAPGDLRPVRALASELTRGDSSPSETPPPAGPPSFPDAGSADQQRVDSAAAGSAYELVRRLSVLFEQIGRTPVATRRDGSLGRLEARRLASVLDLTAAGLRLHIDLALASGLLGTRDGQPEGALASTSDVDAWLECGLAEQWIRLARAWWRRHASSGSPDLKRYVLAAYGPPGSGVVLGAEDLMRWTRWRLPRRSAEARRQMQGMLTSAAVVGVTALGALSSFALADDVRVLAALLPRRDDRVLVQNDLTAIAPSPLTLEAARDLSALAEVESRGGATVYRFTLGSLDHAYDIGWSRQEIEAVLRTRSRTPIPQPLAYLVVDLERRRMASGDPVASGLEQGPRHSPLPRLGLALYGEDDGAAPKVTLNEIVAALRKAESDGDQALADSADARAASPNPAGISDPSDSIEILRQAVETGEPVWVGFVRRSGEPAERVLLARSVEDGRLHATEPDTGHDVTLSVHRISAAHIIRRAAGNPIDPAGARASRPG